MDAKVRASILPQLALIHDRRAKSEFGGLVYVGDRRPLGAAGTLSWELK